VRKFRQGALSSLASRMAAAWRREGNPNPLDMAVKITPAVLAGIGVSEAAQQAGVPRRYLWNICTMYESDECAVALTALREMFGSAEWKDTEGR
jgi:hypothetical protein